MQRKAKVACMVWTIPYCRSTTTYSQKCVLSMTLCKTITHEFKLAEKIPNNERKIAVVKATKSAKCILPNFCFK